MVDGDPVSSRLISGHTDGRAGKRARAGRRRAAPALVVEDRARTVRIQVDAAHVAQRKLRLRPVAVIPQQRVVSDDVHEPAARGVAGAHDGGLALALGRDTAHLEVSGGPAGEVDHRDLIERDRLIAHSQLAICETDQLTGPALALVRLLWSVRRRKR